MTEHERKCFNEALAKNQAHDWRRRTLARLDRKLEPLSPADKIALLRKLDELLG